MVSVSDMPRNLPYLLSRVGVLHLGFFICGKTLFAICLNDTLWGFRTSFGLLCCLDLSLTNCWFSCVAGRNQLQSTQHFYMKCFLRLPCFWFGGQLELSGNGLTQNMMLTLPFHLQFSASTKLAPKSNLMSGNDPQLHRVPVASQIKQWDLLNVNITTDL